MKFCELQDGVLKACLRHLRDLKKYSLVMFKSTFILKMVCTTAIIGCTARTKYPDNQPIFKTSDSLVYQSTKKIAGSEKIEINGRKAVFFDTLFVSGLYVEVFYSYDRESFLKNDTTIAKAIAFKLKSQLVDSNQYETFQISLIREKKGPKSTSKRYYITHFDKYLNIISAMDASEPKKYLKEGSD